MADWEWVEARGFPPIFWVRILLAGFFGSVLPVGMVLIGGPIWSWRLLSFSAPYEPIFLSGAVWFDVLGVPTILVVSAFYSTPRRIGFGPGVVRVDSWLRSRTIAWNDLRPSSLHFYKEWGYLAGWRAGSLFMPAGTQGQSFPLNREQAAAIVAHPSAPVGLFPPEFWKWLGFPPPPGTALPSTI